MEIVPEYCPNCGRPAWSEYFMASRTYRCVWCDTYTPLEKLARKAESAKFADGCGCGGPRGHVPGGLRCRRT